MLKNCPTSQQILQREAQRAICHRSPAGHTLYVEPSERGRCCRDGFSVAEASLVFYGMSLY
jgi:hypothetical protein